jgi:hypothetical protein
VSNNCNPTAVQYTISFWRSSIDRYFHFSLILFAWSLRYSLFSRLCLFSSRFIHSFLGQECSITNRVSRLEFITSTRSVNVIFFGISIRFLVRLGKLSFDLIIEAILRFDYTYRCVFLALAILTLSTLYCPPRYFPVS